MGITKGKLLVEGGEGYIYDVADNPSLLMKVYKEKDLSGAPIITRELQSKLEYMKNNPPEALVSKGIVAWPVELIKDTGTVHLSCTCKMNNTRGRFCCVIYLKLPLIEQ
jgi:DNA-binding helix-hairpin-helix protein with protein kinase domain